MEKEVRFIVTFYNNAGAMGFKAACEQKGVEGRLIPIPADLKAGCGLVWSAPLTARKGLVAMLEDPQIEYCERVIMAV